MDNAHDAQQTKKENDDSFIPQTEILARVEGGFWNIEIRDNGIGMQPNPHPELELFFI